MAVFTRVNGAGFTSVDTLYSTSQIDAYLITVRSTSNGDNTAVDLRADDGTVEGKVEEIVRELSPLMYFVDDGANGTMHVIVDGHANTAASIAARVEALDGIGTDTAVVLGGAIAVSAGNNAPVQTGDS